MARSRRRRPVERASTTSPTSTWCEVTVEAVDGDRAQIEFWDSDFSQNYRPDLSLEREGRWSGTVPVGSLADVEERVVEIRS